MEGCCDYMEKCCFEGKERFAGKTSENKNRKRA